MALSPPSLGRCRALSLSAPLSSRPSMAWRLWFCVCRQRLKLLNTSHLPRLQRLVMLLLPFGLSARAFPLDSGMERISEGGKKIYRSMSVSEHWGCTTLSLNPTNNVDWKYLKAIIVNLCWWNRTWFTGVHVPWIYLLSRWWRRQLRSRLFCPLSNTWRLSTVVSFLWLLILPRNIPGIFRANWMWGMTAILSHKICRLRQSVCFVLKKKKKSLKQSWLPVFWKKTQNIREIKRTLF